MSLPPSLQRCRRSPTALIDDAMSEIFLRIPPDDTKSLVRAAAVCTGWQAILSNVVFTREYRAFHEAPPMLGFLHNERHERSYSWIAHWGRRVEIVEENLVSNFVSTGSFRPPACHERSDWHVIDSRHGLALFRTPQSSHGDFVICDLVTYDQWKIDSEYWYPGMIWNGFGDVNEGVTWNAAVLCAKEQCNHIYCHGGPFLVAFVGSDLSSDEVEGIITFACVYSSVTRKWNDRVFLDEPCAIQMMGHNAVVGNKVYFPCQVTDSVLEYDMAPPACVVCAGSPSRRGTTVASESPSLLRMGRRRCCSSRPIGSTVVQVAHALQLVAVAWA